MLPTVAQKIRTDEIKVAEDNNRVTYTLPAGHETWKNEKRDKMYDFKR